MNNIFKVIWNSTLGQFVVTSELATAKGKSSSSSDKRINPSSISKKVIHLSRTGLAMLGSSASLIVVTTGLTASVIAPEAEAATAMNGTASNYLSIAIGGAAYGNYGYAYATGYKATAVGAAASASGSQSVALGSNTTANGDQSMAIGSDSVASGYSSIAIGSDDLDTIVNTTVAGYYVPSGYQATTGSATGAIVIGARSVASGTLSTVLGSLSNASGNGSTIVGSASNATANASTVVGYNSTASGINSTVVGSFASATATNATALGYNAQASAADTTAIGTGAKANTTNATAIGTGSKASGIGSISLGTNANSSSNNAVAIGNSSNATATNALALGYGASAGTTNSVALGSNSSTSAVVNTTSATVGNITYSGFAGTAATGTVSVGAAGNERTITNVLQVELLPVAQMQSMDHNFILLQVH